MINRINLILRAKNVTPKQFADEIGIQPSGMSHILSGRNNPSLDFVTKVLRRYPEIDANWLVLGIGEMYTTGEGMPATANTTASTSTPPLPSPESPSDNFPTLFSDVADTNGTELGVPLLSTTVSTSEQHNDLALKKGGAMGEATQPMPNEGITPYRSTQPTAIVGETTSRVNRLFLLYDDNTFDIFTPHQSSENT